MSIDIAAVKAKHRELAASVDGILAEVALIASVPPGEGARSVRYSQVASMAKELANRASALAAASVAPEPAA